MAIRVARLSQGDVAKASALARRVMLATPYYPREVLEEEARRFTPAALRKRGRGTLFLVARDGTEVLGFCAGYHEDGGLFWLDWIGVDARARGRGVGRALLGALEEAVGGKARKIWCDTRTTNEESMALLRKQGYERVAEYRRHWYGLDFYIWEKRLE